MFTGSRSSSQNVPNEFTSNWNSFIVSLIKSTIHIHAYYLPQRSWAKVMFLQASVILSTRGGLPQCMLGYHSPQEQTPPPLGADTPWDQTHPGTRLSPPPGSRRQHMVNERPVRILLECILVSTYFYCF